MRSAPARRVSPLSLVLAVAFAMGGDRAWAADRFGEPLARASDKVGIVSDRATHVLRAVAPGRAYPLRGEAAVQKYMDCMADEMLGKYDDAATGLFTLVTTGVLNEFGLHRDAEWSLAESLFGGGNDETAEIRLKAILDDPTHPFRNDAVRTLLELYAKEGRTQEFYELYRAEIASGRVHPTEVITYSVGKSFFLQGTFSYAEATRQFQALPATSRFYGRAQYFLGAIAVKSGDLVAAVPIFEAITKLPVNDDDDRKVRDLSMLALGRIYYERSEFAQAQEWYAQLSGDSPYLDRALYESAWNFIKQGKNAEALRAIDIYLVSFPDGEGAAELTVVQGQLHMLDKSWDQALGSFDGVVTGYTPVKEQFGTLARSTEEPATYFQRVLAIGQGKATDIPAYARTLVLADPDLARAIHLFGTLDQENTDIAASQQLIADLNVALSSAERLDPVSTKAEIDSVQLSIDDQRKGLLELEEEWLTDNGATHAQVDPLRDRRLALGDHPDTEAVRNLRADYATLRKGRSPTTLTRIDELHGALDRAESEIQDASGRLTSPDVQDVKKLREVLDAEVVNVSAEQADYTKTLADAQRVSVALTRAGFGRLEDLFGQEVLSADMGIVDVYWGEKIETASHKEDVLQQRVDVLQDLDRRFDMIRQKMGQE